MFQAGLWFTGTHVIAGIKSINFKMESTVLPMKEDIVLPMSMQKLCDPPGKMGALKG